MKSVGLLLSLAYIHARKATKRTPRPRPRGRHRSRGKERPMPPLDLPASQRQPQPHLQPVHRLNEAHALHHSAVEENVQNELSISLPHSLEAAKLARQRTRACFQPELSPETLDDALLVVTELVTNSVRYARPPITLTASLAHEEPRVLHIEVTDAGPVHESAQTTSPRPPDENGRGNDIIAALSMKYGTRPSTATAVTRWADISDSCQDLTSSQRKSAPSGLFANFFQPSS